MPSNSTSPANDIAPVAVADAFTLTAQQASLVTHNIFTYVDSDGVTQTVDTEVDGTVIDVTANDTDANPNDAGHFWIFGLTQPVDANGNPVGSVSVENAADGHQVVRFYDPTPNDSGPQTVTFTYRVGDQWAASDTAPFTNTMSPPVTVTVTISGNAVPGETLTAPESSWFHPAHPITGGAGNDVMLGTDDGDTLNGGAGADTLVGAEGSDVLNGGDGNDRLYGGGHVFSPIEQWLRHTTALYSPDDGWFDWGGGRDTLNGGNGDDTLTGGGFNDRFVFDYGFGHDVITDFHPLSDKIAVDHNMWGSFSDLKAHAAQVGTSVVLTSDFGGNTITLQNMKLAYLFSSDFVFT